MDKNKISVSHTGGKVLELWTSPVFSWLLYPCSFLSITFSSRLRSVLTWVVTYNGCKYPLFPVQLSRKCGSHGNFKGKEGTEGRGVCVLNSTEVVEGSLSTGCPAAAPPKSAVATVATARARGQTPSPSRVRGRVPLGLPSVWQVGLRVPCERSPPCGEPRRRARSWLPQSRSHEEPVVPSPRPARCPGSPGANWCVHVRMLSLQLCLCVILWTVVL